MKFQPIWVKLTDSERYIIEYVVSIYSDGGYEGHIIPLLDYHMVIECLTQRMFHVTKFTGEDSMLYRSVLTIYQRCEYIRSQVENFGGQ